MITKKRTDGECYIVLIHTFDCLELRWIWTGSIHFNLGRSTHWAKK